MEAEYLPSDVLMNALVQVGVVSDPETNPSGEWPCTTNFLPDQPDYAVALTDTTGRREGRTSRRVIHHPGVQIRIRGIDTKRTKLRAAKIKNALDNIFRASVTLDGQEFLINSAQHFGIIAAGTEEDGRRRTSFTINAILNITEV